MLGIHWRRSLRRQLLIVIAVLLTMAAVARTARYMGSRAVTGVSGSSGQSAIGHGVGLDDLTRGR